jgi:predicted transcriptional regulator
MLDLLQARPGMSIAALSSHFEMSAVGVLKHVRVLERAGLVVSEKRGRERRLYFNVVPIQQIHDRWTDQYSEFWATRVVDLKARLESRERNVQPWLRGRRGRCRRYSRS